MPSAVESLLRSSRRLTPVTAAALGLGAAAVLLLVAATALPWATYKSAATGTVRFDGGELGSAVLCLAIMEMVLALWLWLRPVAIIASVSVAVGVGSLVVAAALALHSISRANTVYRYAPGPSQSAYGLGSGAGVLAALAFVVIGAVTTGHLVNRRGDRENGREAAPRGA